MMTDLGDVRRLYESYLAQARQAEANRKPLEGAFGLGPKRGDDPCHSRFKEDLEALLKAAAEESLESGELRAMLSYIYSAPKKNREPLAAYWMLKAVHGLTLELVGRLRPEDAAELWKKYQADYPRWDRLPVQKKVLQALDLTRKRK